jgi:serralysin
MYAEETVIDGSPTVGDIPWFDSLIWGGAWFSPDGPTTISFAAVEGVDPWGDLPGTSMTWSSAGLNALDFALSSWEAVASIDFVEVDLWYADVWFWQGTDDQASSALGWSDIPAYSSGEPLFTVLNGEHSTWSSEALVVGGYGYVTIIHELGHLLGLAHPHDGGSDGDLFPGVSSPFGDFGDDDLNQGVFTTMSYNDGWATEYPAHSDWSYGWQGTPMALDIAAIQYIYGANNSHNTGNDTYVLPETNASGTFWSCIWDAGGSDTISNEGNTGACNINLNEAPLIGPNAGGYVSWVSEVIGGYTIANGAVIENAIGGLGDDTLTGNAESNTISGDAGDDILDGGAGDDILDGGAGDDILDGGAGDDTYVVDSASDEVTEGTSAGKDLVKVAIAAVGGSYNLGSNIENATLTNTVAYKLYGNLLDNKLVGNAKDNTLNGGAGKDILAGGAGNDTYVVDSVSDVVTELASSGIDMVEVAIAADGGSYNLGLNIENATLKNTVAYKLYGNSLDNKLVGNAKDNTLNGGTGKDTLTGGSGKDKFVFDTSLSSSNIDTIKDFTKGDKIVLDDDVFKKFSVKEEVSLDAKYFGSSGKQATGKAGADDYFYFKGSILYYDADGNGSGKANAVVELVGITSISASDILITS